jgi:hypothetical protein
LYLDDDDFVDDEPFVDEVFVLDDEDRFTVVDSLFRSLFEDDVEDDEDSVFRFEDDEDEDSDF